MNVRLVNQEFSVSRAALMPFSLCDVMRSQGHSVTVACHEVEETPMRAADRSRGVEIRNAMPANGFDVAVVNTVVCGPMVLKIAPRRSSCRAPTPATRCSYAVIGSSARNSTTVRTKPGSNASVMPSDLMALSSCHLGEAVVQDHGITVGNARAKRHRGAVDPHLRPNGLARENGCGETDVESPQSRRIVAA